MIYKDIGIVIPAYNEEAHLEVTLRALREVSSYWDILVVDDGSKDQTGTIALREGARVINLEKNYGKGYALQKGLESLNNSIVAFLDADIGDTSKEVIKLIQPLLDDQADVTIGKIDFTPGKGGFGIVKGLSQKAFKSLTGIECTSVLSGQRAFRKQKMDPNFLNYKGYGIEFGMTVDMVQRRLRIMEIPVEIRHRITGKDFKGFEHRFKQFLDILVVVLTKKIKPYGAKG